MPFIITIHGTILPSQSVRQLSWSWHTASADLLTFPWSIPENSSGENWLSDELVWLQEIPTEKDLLLCGEGAMISIHSFVEKGSILRILTEGASTGLGELSGQSVLSSFSQISSIFLATFLVALPTKH